MSARLHQDDNWPRPMPAPGAPVTVALRLVDDASSVSRQAATLSRETLRFAAWTAAMCLLTVGPGAFPWEFCRIGGEALIVGLFLERCASAARKGALGGLFLQRGAWSGLACAWALAALASAAWGFINGWGVHSPYPAVLYNGGASGPLRQVTDTLVALMGFYAAIPENGESPTVRRLIPIGVAASTTLALCGVEAARNTLFGASDPRLQATFTNPNLLGAFLCIALPVSVGIALDAKNGRGARLSAATLAVALGWALWMSGSRGALLGCAVGIGFLFACWASMKIKAAIARDPTTRLRLVPVAAMILVLTALPIAARVSQHFANGTGAHVTSDDQRRVAWHGALLIIEQHPVTGLGLGSYPAALGALGLRQTNPATADGLPTIPAMHLHAHDLLLEFWAERGLPGVALACALIGLTLTTALTCFKRKAASLSGTLQAIGCAALLAILTQNIADYTLWYAPLLVLFWQLPALMTSNQTADNR